MWGYAKHGNPSKELARGQMSKYEGWPGIHVGSEHETRPCLTYPVAAEVKDYAWDCATDSRIRT